MSDGYTAFNLHRACAVYQSFMPAETVDGACAVSLWLPPPVETLIQMVTPHDTARAAWIAGWDRARAEFTQKERKDED